MEMENTMTADEFHNWLQYHQYEPLNRVDIQLAQLTMLVSSALGGKGKFDDFYPGKKPGDDEEKKPLSPQSLDKIIRGMF